MEVAGIEPGGSGLKAQFARRWPDIRICRGFPRADVQHLLLKRESRAPHGRSVFAVTGRQFDVVSQDRPCPQGLAGTEKRADSSQQRECLAIVDGEYEAGRMVRLRDTLSRDLAGPNDSTCECQQRSVRVADGNREVAIFIPVVPTVYSSVCVQAAIRTYS